MAAPIETLPAPVGSGTPRRPARAKATEADRRHRRGAARWFVLAAAVVVAVVMMVPFVIMVLNAFKAPADYSQNGPLSWPAEFYTEGLRNFWDRVNFPEKLVNSIWISGAVAVFGTLLSLLSAYALGVGRVKGRMWIVTLFLLANMLPQEVLVYPLFQMAQDVGLSNNQWSVIIIFTVIQAAFGTYLLSSVLGTFPKALLEAAALDGAGKWRTLWGVVFPVVRPTLSVLLIFFFIWTWNEFFIPLVMLTTNATQTIPVALASLQGDRMMDAPTTNAGALVSMIPAIIFFLIFQRTLTRGITAGAVK
ncbi:ABC transporter permease [Cellulomonas hominis]|uniref:ABC transporter permease n=1 Tax=Cellulomonas hominis TaxID=156981 RepID=A0A511FHA2_9CELL|nr:carbohydrate ABC transporter permease [Cellulomonas hominis]MBB5471730.1 raffinose/stachyose/melibiose transport system permease protein [Cellulomonas hominis]NKY06550.1 carbohydrate ABC transporter permease [Cellulomonas hominis]GEL47717.1 ABC transporter permease [Cellulomonas hominis]